jgi:hypothetical protein
MRILLVFPCVAETLEARYMKRQEAAMATKARPAATGKMISTERMNKFRAATRAQALDDSH